MGWLDDGREIWGSDQQMPPQKKEPRAIARGHDNGIFQVI